MCIAFLAIDAHPGYPLILAANRDEFYARPSRPADYWPEAPELLAGRDELAGGTWLGISRDGRLAFLTNVRDAAPPPDEPLTRGVLPRDYLLGDQPARAYLQDVLAEGQRYAGFNLVLGRPDELLYASNRADGGPEALPAGLHGLSNAALDTPWPKVERGKRRLAALLAEAGEEEALIDGAFAILEDGERAPEADLPQTPVPREVERVLSSIFIASPGYGTRCSTLVLVDRLGAWIFIEKTQDPGPGRGKSRVHRFSPPAA